mmetsp:Transcript_27643/g.40812  ORF Transcript_27643/g.40812 Transcript_27643/m.40812 type:complete len:769 (-) Transcript_27643:70-2376(-)
MPTMCSLQLTCLTLVAALIRVEGHSWIEELQSPYGKGMSRVGMPTKSDSYLIRYFCPYEDLDDCQPDPKHGIDLYNLPPSNGDPRRPCRSGFESDPKTPVRSGSDVLISWAGNGHVANGQSDGTCVKVMLGLFEDDPSINDFVEIPGAECLDYWIFNSKGQPASEGTITIPDDVAPGQYTLFWSWNFTEFWYSSCADIDVLSEGEVTLAPTKSPIRDGPDQDDIDYYLNNGCSDLHDPSDFCERYSGLGENSFCQEDFKDSCGRSSCEGLDRSMLIPCPDCPPTPGPPGCSIPEPFYDDFSNGFDSAKWLKAHKSWGSGDDFKNGGVVEENIRFDESAGKVILEVHGSQYNGNIMGVERGDNGDINRMNSGVRTGAAIATRDYFGAGSYEVRMKIAEPRGVCSAIWTFYYSDQDYYYGIPIVNHEIDIELPGRPSATLDNINFDKALMNTWVGEKAHLHTVNYTQLDAHMNDGNFHTWRFDWHTDELDRRVDFFLDDKLFATNRDHVPFYSGRLWIGAWFPNKWAGEANFDISQMEIDYVKITPFENEVYACPPESYPRYGWAPGTIFNEESTPDHSQQVSPERCSPPTPPLTSSPTNGPVSFPTLAPVLAPTGNTAAHDTLYSEFGCTMVPPSYCEDAASGSYCKDWSSDECGRSVCQGPSFTDLDPCSSPSDEDSHYNANGCANFPNYCSTYCKDWSSDECGRSICQGQSFSALDPCPVPSDEGLYKTNGCANLPNYCTTYCKDYQQDHCGRAVCHGDSYSNLYPC